MIDLDRPFFSVKEAAEILGIGHSTLCEAVRTGKIKAVEIGNTTASARIPRTELFPSEGTASDLRTRRLRRLTLNARDKRDLADRKRAEWLEYEREADEALREVEHAQALDEIEAADERSKRLLTTG
jgi:excisionase family DNA binding protein